MSYIYGLIPVLEAMRAGKRRINEIHLAEGNRPARIEELLNAAKRTHVPVRYQKRAQLDRMANGANHQGVIAVVTAAEYTDLEDVLTPGLTNALFVLLDNVEDPHNLGAVIRTAECAGANAVIIPEHHAVGITDAVVKASAGAVEYMPIVRVTNLVQAIDRLKSENIWVIGVEAEGRAKYTEWDFRGSSAIVLGSEGKGLRRLTKEHCDALVSIPLLGHVTSLNVSVAAGIVLYETVRQRRGPGKAESGRTSVGTDNG